MCELVKLLTHTHTYINEHKNTDTYMHTFIIAWLRIVILTHYNACYVIILIITLSEFTRVINCFPILVNTKFRNILQCCFVH